MADPETELERIARLTHEETQAIREDVRTLRDQMVTNLEVKDMEDRLVMHLTELKADIRRVIADETANALAIARLEKRAGLTT